MRMAARVGATKAGILTYTGGLARDLAPHECGHDFTPTVMCHHCRHAIRAADMSHRLNYRPTPDGKPPKPGRPIGVGEP